MDTRSDGAWAPLGRRIEQLAATRYAIVFAVRSGSTLLCDDLAQVGLGAPTEHFQGPMLGPVAAHVERVVRADGPVFGTKVSWEQAFSLLRRLADEGAIHRFDLREAFGDDLRVIRLVRRNKIRQAVSAWRAAKTGVWHLPAGSAPESLDPGYERGALISLVMQFLAEDWLWERHVEEAGLDALTVVYEEYARDRSGCLAKIARYVGHPLDRTPVLADRIQQMADAWTDRLEQRLLDDLSAPVHPFWAAPELWDSVPASVPLETCVPLPRAPAPALGQEAVLGSGG
jgi:trehalose 2-sulfotransferase